MNAKRHQHPKMNYEEVEDIGLGHMTDEGFMTYDPEGMRSVIRSEAKSASTKICIDIKAEMAKARNQGFQDITRKELLSKLPVNALPNTHWQVLLQDEYWTIKQSIVAGIEIMSFNNGYMDEPYFIKQPQFDIVQYLKNYNWTR